MGEFNTLQKKKKKKIDKKAQQKSNQIKKKIHLWNEDHCEKKENYKAESWKQTCDYRQSVCRQVLTVCVLPAVKLSMTQNH